MSSSSSNKIKILSPTSPGDIAAVCSAHNLSPREFQALLEHARDAKARAYCPYSRFRVGAALLLGEGEQGDEGKEGKGEGERGRGDGDGDGEGEGEGEEGFKIVVGANVENASYPVTTCAERVAFGTAVVSGQLRRGADGVGTGGCRAVAVATDGVGPASPCGMCRQFIREFCDVSVPIIMFDKDSNFVVMTLEELLPLSFGPENMGVPGPSKPAAGKA